ncbi:fatty acid-binding protein 10-A, liver basic-like [Sardina pilchardus]|uniref:fatty acid-binding protein 10-A, liver basic-like n=1 Tax=Sardina pilchardus TaxID=27697 RepID=UPI002E12A906
MAFNGAWQMYSQENHEEFFKVLSVPDTLVRIMRDVKPVTEIEQNGEDFVVTVKTPLRSTSNSFTLGRESIMNTMDGKKLKCMARMEDGKLICTTDKFTHVREVQGEEMVETMTAGATSLIRRSKKI